MEMSSHDKHHSSLCIGCSFQRTIDKFSKIFDQSRDQVPENPHNKDSEDNLRVIESNNGEVDQTSKLTTNPSTLDKKLTNVEIKTERTVPVESEQSVDLEVLQVMQNLKELQKMCESCPLDDNMVTHTHGQSVITARPDASKYYANLSEFQDLNEETKDCSDLGKDSFITNSTDISPDFENLNSATLPIDVAYSKCVIESNNGEVDQTSKLTTNPSTLGKKLTNVEIETERTVPVESEQSVDLEVLQVMQNLKELQKMCESCPLDDNMVTHTQGQSVITARPGASKYYANLSEFQDLNEETKDCSDLGKDSFITNSTNIFPDLVKINSATLPIGVAYSKDHNSILEPKHIRTLFITGLDYRTTDVSLKYHFKQWGEIVDVIVKKHGHGVITYSRAYMVDNAQIARPHRVDGRVVVSKRQGISANGNTLYVGIPIEDIDENDLKDYFKMYGHIVSCNIVVDNETGKTRGFGLVEFDDYDPVDKICLQRFHVIKNKHLGVQKALSKVEIHRKLENTGRCFERENNQNLGNWRSRGGNWNSGSQGGGSWGNGANLLDKQCQTGWSVNRGGTMRSNFNRGMNRSDPYGGTKRRWGEYVPMSNQYQCNSGNNINRTE